MKPEKGKNCSAVSRGGFVRNSARIMRDPSLVARVAARRLRVGSFGLRCDLDLFVRPQYAYGVQQAALLARSLKLPAVSVIEFGVAGGAGLVELERVAREATASLLVQVDVYGFDRGDGLAEPHGYKDLPYRWQGGFFKMDLPALRKRLTSAELVLGDLSATVPAFADRGDMAPIGFVAVDLDYYSATTEALKLFEVPTTRLLPRVWCYLDDVTGDDISLHNEFVGELAAVHEFSEAHAERKIAKIHGLANKRIWPSAWCEQMYALHCFDHPDYCTYVGPAVESQQLPLADE